MDTLPFIVPLESVTKNRVSEDEAMYAVKRTRSRAASTARCRGDPVPLKKPCQPIGTVAAGEGGAAEAGRATEGLAGVTPPVATVATRMIAARTPTNFPMEVRYAR